MREAKIESRLALAGAILGGLALILAVFVLFQASSNRSLQHQLADGQAQMTKAQTLVNLDNSLVQLMVKTAVDTNDTALRELLAANGVTFKPGTAAPSTPVPPQGVKP